MATIAYFSFILILCTYLYGTIKPSYDWKNQTARIDYDRYALAVLLSIPSYERMMVFHLQQK